MRIPSYTFDCKHSFDSRGPLSSLYLFRMSKVTGRRIQIVGDNLIHGVILALISQVALIVFRILHSVLFDDRLVRLDILFLLVLLHGQVLHPICFFTLLVTSFNDTT